MSKARSDGARRPAKGPRKRRATPTAKPPPAVAPVIDEVDRGLPQPEGARRTRGPNIGWSVEDPLGDWPDTDADRRLLDRKGEGVEAPDE
jgi:hypothetical protein